MSAPINPSDSGDNAQLRPLEVVNAVVRDLGIAVVAEELGVHAKTVSRHLDDWNAWSFEDLKVIARLEREHGSDDLGECLRHQLSVAHDDDPRPMTVQDSLRQFSAQGAAVFGAAAEVPTMIRPGDEQGLKSLAGLRRAKQAFDAAFQILERDLAAALGVVPFWKRFASASSAVALVFIFLFGGDQIARPRQLRRQRRRDEMVLPL